MGEAERGGRTDLEKQQEEGAWARDSWDKGKGRDESIGSLLGKEPMRSHAESRDGDGEDGKREWLGNWRQAGNGTERQAGMGNRASSGTESWRWTPGCAAAQRAWPDACTSRSVWSRRTRRRRENMGGVLRPEAAPQLRWEPGARTFGPTRENLTAGSLLVHMGEPPRPLPGTVQPCLGPKFQI